MILSTYNDSIPAERCAHTLQSSCACRSVMFCMRSCGLFSCTTTRYTTQFLCECSLSFFDKVGGDWPHPRNAGKMSRKRSMTTRPSRPPAHDAEMSRSVSARCNSASSVGTYGGLKMIRSKWARRGLKQVNMSATSVSMSGVLQEEEAKEGDDWVLSTARGLTSVARTTACGSRRRLIKCVTSPEPQLYTSSKGASKSAGKIWKRICGREHHRNGERGIHMMVGRSMSTSDCLRNGVLHFRAHNYCRDDRLTRQGTTRL